MHSGIFAATKKLKKNESVTLAGPDSRLANSTHSTRFTVTFYCKKFCLASSLCLSICEADAFCVGFFVLRIGMGAKRC